jgi:hypothetical protein
MQNSESSLKMLRVDTAIQMCIQTPHLTEMILSNSPDEPRNYEEKIRFGILQELVKIEPSILHILKFYHKRGLA